MNKAERIERLEREIFRMKARMREYGLHDDWCQNLVDIEHRSSLFGEGPVLKIRPCNCWLSKDDDDDE